MTRTGNAIVICTLALAAVLTSADAIAQGVFKARLNGFAEVPALSTTGSGELNVHTSPEALNYTLSYEALEGNVLQAHIHLGQLGVNGGVSVFLCTNLGNGPAGTPACPAAPATVTGTLTADDVIGPAGQGIAPGEFEELLRAIEAGATYGNVHTDLRPAGEIRGQLRRGSGN